MSIFREKIEDEKRDREGLEYPYSFLVYSGGISFSTKSRLIPLLLW